MGSEQVLGNRGRAGRSWLAVSRLRWERLRSVRYNISGLHPTEQRRYSCFVVVFPNFLCFSFAIFILSHGAQRIVSNSFLNIREFRLHGLCVNSRVC